MRERRSKHGGSCTNKKGVASAYLESAGTQAARRVDFSAGSSQADAASEIPGTNPHPGSSHRRIKNEETIPSPRRHGSRINHSSPLAERFSFAPGLSAF